MRCQIDAGHGLDVPLNCAGLIGERKRGSAISLVGILNEPAEWNATLPRLLLKRCGGDRVRCRLGTKQRNQASRNIIWPGRLSDSNVGAQNGSDGQRGKPKPTHFISDRVRHSDPVWHCGSASRNYERANTCNLRKRQGRQLPEDQFDETSGKEKCRFAARVLAKLARTKQESRNVC